MPSATVGLLKVILTAESAEYEAALKKAAGAAQAWSKDLKQIGTQATQVGSALTKTITLPIVGLAAASVKAAMDFESSFANVAKTVDGVSDKFGKLTPVGLKLANSFRQMAKEIPATTDELNAIAAMGGQMGVPINQLEKFTKNVAALGVAVDGISAEQAAADLASIGNATGTGTTKIQEMASALVHLGNNSNATEADILEFTKRLVGAGSAAGMTVPEVMAIGTAMANVGINAEAGGTAMSTVIGKIGKAVSLGSQDLEEFAKVAGKTSEEFAAVWKRSSAEGIDLFVQGLGTMKQRGVDLNLTMGELGTEGIRVASTLKLLAGAGNGVGTSIKLANEGFAAGNKHLEEAEKKYATTANQLKVLWNNITDIGITLGNAFLPGIKSATAILQSLLPIVDAVAHAFAAAPGPIQAIIIGLGLAVAAVGPLIYIFGQLVLSTSAVIGAFGKKGIATRLLAADQEALTATSGRLSTALGLLGKAAAVAAAGFVGWQIGRLISDLFGLDEKIAGTLEHIEALKKARGATAQGGESGQAAVTAQLTKLRNEANAAIQRGNDLEASRLLMEIGAIEQDQTRLAMLDTLNKAISLGADKNITYAKAVEFLAQKEKERLAGIAETAAAQQRVGGSTQALTDKIDGLAAKMKKADADIASLSSTAREKLASALKSGAFEMKELEAASGLSEFAIKRFQSQMKETAKSTKEATGWIDTFRAGAKRLEKELDMAAKAGVPMTIVLEEFGGEIEKVVNRAPMLGDAIGKATQAAADAIKKNSLAALLQKESAEALDRQKKFIDSIIDQAEKAGTRLTAGIQKNFDGQSKAMNDYAEDRERLTVSAYDFELSQMERARQAEIATLDKRRSGYEEAVTAISRKWAEKMAQARAAHNIEVEAMKAAVDSYGKRLVNVLEAIPTLLKSALTGGGGMAGFGKALTAQIGESLLGKGATDLLNKSVQGLFNKGLAGVDLVSGLAKMIPGIGAAIGSLMGPLLDNIINKLFGHAGRDAVKAFAETMGGFDALRAKLIPLGAEGAMLWRNLTQGTGSNNPKEAAARIKDIEKALADTSAEFARITREGGLASKKMLEFRDATRDTAETIEFIKAATKRAGDGFSAYLQSGAAAYAKLAELQKAYTEASGADRDKIAAQIKEQQSLIAAVGVSSQQAAEGIGAALAGTFGQMVAGGMSAREALAALAPGIEGLNAQLAATGFTGGAAFEDISRLAGIAAGTISGPALDAIHNLTIGLEGAQNAGFLTQEMFAGITAQINVSRQALIDQGVSAEDANRLMARDLQTIWQLQKDFGYQVDDTTQTLLDEAEASGLVGDAHRSAMDRAAIAMEKAAKAIIRAFGGIEDEADNLGKKIDHATRPRLVKVEFDADAPPEYKDPSVGPRAPARDDGYDQHTLPVHDPAPASVGAMVTRSGLRYLAGGGYGALGKALTSFWKPKGTDTQPAMLTPGEIVMNEGQQANVGAALDSAMAFVNSLKADFSSMGALAGPQGGGSSSSITIGDIHVHGDVPDKETAREIGISIVTEIRRGGDVRTMWQREVTAMVGK